MKDYSLSTVLTAMDQKCKQNHKKVILLSIKLTFSLSDGV